MARPLEPWGADAGATVSDLVLPEDPSIVLPGAPTPFRPEVMPGDGPTVTRLKVEAARKLSLLPPTPEERLRVLGTKSDFFAASSLRIRPKETEGGLAPFVFNPIQMDHLAGLRLRHRMTPGADFFTGVRDIILKPRQLGFTTYLAALYFFDALFRPGRNTLVLTHLDKVSQKVLEIYRAFYDSLPPEIKASVALKRASALHLELQFLGPDGRPDPVGMPPSSFMVHTAQGLDLRGVTVHNLHLSEAAFYSNWVELTRGIIQAVPASGNITLESTANGFNHFKDLVDAALKGSGRYRLIFYPWFAHPEYALDLTPEATLALEESLEEDERLLVLNHRVSLAQIAWRRDKLGEMGGSKDSFRQEYPSTVLDAFLSSGRPVFDAEVVSRNFELAKGSPKLAVDPFTTVFSAPEPGVLYLVCADPAEGIDKGEGDAAAEIGGTDFSSAYVLDSRNLRTVAALHGRIEPVDFARRVALLGHQFNDALAVVERNNHGHVVLFALEEAGYPNLYRHMEYDAAGTAFLKLGFPMTTATRPLVVDTLREVVGRDSLPCPDPRFWSEAQVFVWGPDGKPAAMPTRHDDRVMSMAIGVYVGTLGAKAWGGSGLLQRADGAGLPLPGAVGAPPPAAPVPVAPPSAPAAPTASAPLGGMFPRPGAMLEPPPGPDGQPSAPHTALAALAAQRQEVESGGSPRCGNCAHRTERNGAVLCGLNGWVVRDQDPDCGAWEPPPESYNEGVVYRVSIGGVE